MKNKSLLKGRGIKIERLTALDAKSIFAGSCSMWGGTTGHPTTAGTCDCVCDPAPVISPGGTEGSPTIDTCSCACC